jgi:ubiquitin carboxyl-terminal hydrolase 25/28
MKKHKYLLHSILIHEGAADTGHYYAYIYNPYTSKWYKFNDIHVTEVLEDKVMKDAYGDGKSKTNAYCLIYHKERG